MPPAAFTTFLSMSTQNVCKMMRAIRGEPNRGLRDLSSTMAWMSALVAEGPRRSLARNPTVHRQGLEGRVALNDFSRDVRDAACRRLLHIRVMPSMPSVTP